MDRGGTWPRPQLHSQPVAAVGFQNESPQDVSLWYAAYFELKATLALGSRETSTHPLIYKNLN